MGGVCLFLWFCHFVFNLDRLYFRGKKIYSLIFHLSLPVLYVQLHNCSRLQWLSFDGVSKIITFLCPRFCLITGLEKLPFLPFSEQLVHVIKRARYLYTVTQLQTYGGSNPSALPLASLRDGQSLPSHKLTMEMISPWCLSSIYFLSLRKEIFTVLLEMG